MTKKKKKMKIKLRKKLKINEYTLVVIQIKKPVFKKNVGCSDFSYSKKKKIP